MTGEAIPILLDLVNRGIIRVLDARFVRKDARDLPGLRLRGLEQETVGDPAVFAGASTGLLGDDDLTLAAAEIELGSAAVTIVHGRPPGGSVHQRCSPQRWRAYRHERIGVQDLIDALEAAEAAA